MRQPTSAGGDAGFVRADQIDLKSLDEQFERHLGRPAERGVGPTSGMGNRRGESARLGPEELTPLRRCREDWEIDPAKLVIKGVIARGTFGTSRLIWRRRESTPDLARRVPPCPISLSPTLSLFSVPPSSLSLVGEELRGAQGRVIHTAADLGGHVESLQRGSTRRRI